MRRIAAGICILIFTAKFAAAEQTACDAQLIPAEQILNLMAALDIRNSTYDSSPEYQMLLEQIQAKLKSYGIDSRLRRRKMEDKVRRVIELTDISPVNVNVNGKIILRARERFGVKVIVDPVMNLIGEGRGSTDAPEKPLVYLDSGEILQHFDQANTVLLHEIRHVFLSARTGAGFSHIYQGEMISVKGYLFEDQGFYEDEISFEELSNYARDSKVHARRFRNSQLSHEELIKDLTHLKRIAGILIKQLALVREDTPARWLFTEDAETFKGVILVWPVFRAQFTEKDQIFYVHLDFPGAPRRTSARLLRAQAWNKIVRMQSEAQRLHEYAQDLLQSYAAAK